MGDCCDEAMKGNQVCNRECYFEATDFDMGDCCDSYKECIEVFYIKSHITNEGTTGSISTGTITHDHSGNMIVSLYKNASSLPKITSSASEIIIQPLSCNGAETSTSSCVPDNEKLELTWDSDSTHPPYYRIQGIVKIKNIIFNGHKELFIDCPDASLCTYCQTDSSDAPCKKYHDMSLFNLKPGAILTLEHVEFINWRSELKSLIYISQGTLSMQNVNFRNIRVSSQEESAVILVLDNNHQTSITYDQGEVSYLNDGYELRGEINMNGFMHLKSLNKVHIKSVAFQNSFIELSKEEQRYTLGYFIYISSILEFSLINSKFENIFSANSLIYILYPNEPIEGYHYKLSVENLILTHICSYYSVINIRYRVYPQDFNIKDLTIDTVLSYTDPIISITNLYENTSENEYSEVNIHDLSITKSSAIYIIQILNVDKVSMKSVSISELLDFESSNISNFINTFIRPESEVSTMTYLKNEVDFEIPRTVESSSVEYPSSIFISSTKTFNFEDSSIMNTSTENYYNPGLHLEDLLKARLTKLSIYSNQIQSINSYKTYGVIGKEVNEIDAIEFEFRQNHNVGFGGISIENVVGIHSRFNLEDSLFEKNTSNLSNGVILEGVAHVILKRNTFCDNISHYSSNIFITHTLYILKSKVEIQDCLFQDNITTSNDSDDVINIKNSFENKIELEFKLENSKFASIDCKIGRILSLITFKLVNRSTISKIEISESKSLERLLYLKYSTGSLYIENSKFIKNTGTLIYSDIGPHSEESDCYLQIDNCTFSQTIGIDINHSIIYVSLPEVMSKLRTSYCLFEDNDSLSIYLTGDIWADENSKFINNRYDFGGAVYASEGSYFTLLSTVFDANVTKVNGGAIFLATLSQLECHECEFKNNSAGLYGGAIYVEGYSLVIIKDSVIASNSAGLFGGAISFINANLTNFIQNTEIYDNYSGEGYAILAITSSLELDNVDIYENHSEGALPSGIFINMSYFKLLNSKIHQQHSNYGSLLYAVQSKYIYIYNTIFSDSSSELYGLIYLTNSNSVFRKCTFERINFTDEAVIFVGAGPIEIFDSKFDNIKSEEINGSLISIGYTEILLSNTIISNYYGTGLYLNSYSKAEVINSQFYNGETDEGAGIYSESYRTLQITNTKFIDLKAQSGGAIYLDISFGIFPNAKIADSEFINNQAINGGAIYCKNYNLSVYDSIFSNNRAIDIDKQIPNTIIYYGSGGALYYHCEEYICPIDIKNNTFNYNTASYDGGAVSVHSFPAILDSNIFIGNSAQYGKDFSSLPIRVGLAEPLSHRYLQDDDYSITMILNDIPPGQKSEIGFSVFLLDQFNQAIKTDNFTKAEMYTEYGILGDAFTAGAIEGEFYFIGYSLQAEPGSTVDVRVTTSEFEYFKDIYQPEYEFDAIIQMNLRNCIMGEEERDIECFVCPPSQYSLDPKTPCSSCPTGAECHGGFKMTPKSGYWRAGAYTDIFFECPNPESCLDSSDDYTENTIGRCNIGYTGNMCQSCDSGYSRSSRNKCGGCPEKTGNIMKLVGVMIALILACFVLVKSTMRSAYKEKALHSVYMKILMNYLQLVIITASLQISWPEMVLELFSIQESTGNVADQIISIDCFLIEERGLSSSDVYFIKVMIMAILPILIILISSIIWLSVCFYYRTKKYLKNELVSTIIILLFLFHPNIIKTSFSIFSCREIDDGEYWLNEDLNVRCWDSTHIRYSMAFALPSILIWGIGFPATCLMYLYANRRYLKSTHVRMKFGFLFNGFKIEKFYWEFIILYRKIMIICCSVFLTMIPITIQVLILILILIISLHIQYVNKPYITESLNEMEVRSIGVAAVTIYCGMFYITGELNQPAKIFFFIVIIAINCYFIIYWVSKMFEAFVKLLRKLFPCLRRLITGEIEDGFPEDLFVSHQLDKSKQINPARIIGRTHSIDILKDILSSKDLYNSIVKVKNQTRTLRRKQESIINSEVGNLTMIAEDLEEPPYSFSEKFYTSGDTEQDFH